MSVTDRSGLRQRAPSRREEDEKENENATGPAHGITAGPANEDATGDADEDEEEAGQGRELSNQLTAFCETWK